MKRKALWKDIHKSFSTSWGRFLSILLLMALGSFALVGLQVSGPDMRKTGLHYFHKYNSADISILGKYGISQSDVDIISKASGVKDVEYSYLKDVIVKDTNISFRIFSHPEKISLFEITSGQFPQNMNEIVLSNSYQNDYHIGDMIEFSEETKANEKTVLKQHSFKIVGFVNSPELISPVNFGQTTVGTGELNGFAIVLPDVFETNVYMIARLTFNDTFDLDPYSTEYNDLIEKHKDELNELFKDQPEKRLLSIKDEYQENINQGQEAIDEAKQKLLTIKNQLSEAKNKLDQAKQQLAEGKKQLNLAKMQLEEGKEKIQNAKIAIENSEKQIALAKTDFTHKLQALNEQIKYLNEKQEEYDQNIALLNQKKEELAQAQIKIDEQQQEIDASKAQLENVKRQYENNIKELQDNIVFIKKELENPDLSDQERLILNQQLTASQEELNQTIQKYDEFIQVTYTPRIQELTEAQKTLDEKKLEWQKKKKAIEENEQTLALAKQQLIAGYAQINIASKQLDEAKKIISEKESLIASSKEKIAQEEAILQEKISEFAIKEKEFSQKTKEFTEKTALYNKNVNDFEKERPNAKKDIANGEIDLANAKKTLANLKNPVYSINNRREIPGGIGYKIYQTITNIIDSLATIFPCFLYFVAALVTFTTMTRFVDEERINSGTLKALGYQDKDIVKKFVIYGFSSSFVGTILGVILGHMILPNIVYSAYHNGFSLPKIELYFDWKITLLAFILSLISAVIPAYLVAKKALMEKPTTLLQPKAPSAGSKILLEKITPIWKRLGFIQKVTARNIFRYKKRMFMTIFGVCGSVALLFAGFGIQHSISGINERQFGKILRYDLIVAKETTANETEENELNQLLKSSSVSQYTESHYEEVSIIAGKSQDKQPIKLIVPEKSEHFSDYINLIDSKTGKEFSLQEDGVVISKRLSTLLHVKKGDSIVIQDEENHDREVKINGICEMYTGHFIFMTKETYQKVYGLNYSTNAYLTSLKNRDIDNIKEVASTFMTLNSVLSVVQSTTQIRQIDTIVNSLNMIMEVLILIASLLALVILYNLTNINVAERIRELSTIKVLGFYTKEVTAYIYRETIILSLLGIIAGFGFGKMLHSYIITAVPPDEVMFNPHIGILSFLVPVIIIAIITAFLWCIVFKKLKKVDMLEALKSVD